MGCVAACACHLLFVAAMRFVVGNLFFLHGVSWQRAFVSSHFLIQVFL